MAKNLMRALRMRLTSRPSGKSTRATSGRSWKVCRQPDSSDHERLTFDADNTDLVEFVGGAEHPGHVTERDKQRPTLQQAAALTSSKKAGRRKATSCFVASASALPGPPRTAAVLCVEAFDVYVTLFGWGWAI
eukprot:7804511-Pyramimonas_sp.AAC.1